MRRCAASSWGRPLEGLRGPSARKALKSLAKRPRSDYHSNELPLAPRYLTGGLQEEETMLHARLSATHERMPSMTKGSEVPSLRVRLGMAPLQEVAPKWRCLGTFPGPRQRELPYRSVYLLEQQVKHAYLPQEVFSVPTALGEYLPQGPQEPSPGIRHSWEGAPGREHLAQEIHLQGSSEAWGREGLPAYLRWGPSGALEAEEWWTAGERRRPSPGAVRVSREEGSPLEVIWEVGGVTYSSLAGVGALVASTLSYQDASAFFAGPGGSLLKPLEAFFTEAQREAQRASGFFSGTTLEDCVLRSRFYMALLEEGEALWELPSSWVGPLLWERAQGEVRGLQEALKELSLDETLPLGPSL